MRKTRAFRLPTLFSISLILQPALIFTAFCASSDAASAEGTGAPHSVPIVAEAISVDGRLDEPCWDRALGMALEYEVQPGENAPPPVKTEVLVMYSETHFYAAFRAWDPDPSKIRARLCDRDAMYNDDWVALVIDSFNDERRMFEFFVNPLGIQGDLIECAECETDSYDAIWESAGRITEWGYVVEIAVPFSSMRFQRTDGEQVWNFDAVRNYPRSAEHRIGLFPRDRSNNCYLCQAEEISGFAGATPGRNIELDPTFSALYSEERENFTGGKFRERDRRYDPGLTVRWGFTPNLTLQGTVNPDFSQVESDAVELDINNTFAIYYPERRPFFMEGSELFGTNINAAYSRTLADPRWGIKLTGKEGPNAVGYYTVRDEITNLLFPGNQGSASTSIGERSTGTVLRYRRDIFESSNIGILATDREGKDYFNRVAGFDGDLKLTKTDRITFQLLGSRTDYPDSSVAGFGQPAGRFDGAAGEVIYMHETEKLEAFAFFYDYGEKFRADLGFVPKTGARHYETGLERNWNAEAGKWFTHIDVGGAYELDEDPEGRQLVELGNLWVDYSGPMQSEVNFVTHFYAKVDYGEERFNYRHYHLSAGARPGAAMKFFINHTFGDLIDYANTRQATVLSFNPGIEYRLGRHLSLDFDHTWERLEVEEGLLYSANIGNMRLIYQFNGRTFVRANMQYVYYERDAGLYLDEVDPRTKKLFSQLLFSYKINPQTVLYLGYSDNYFGFQGVELTQTDRTFFVKFGYAWVL